MAITVTGTQVKTSGTVEPALPSSSPLAANILAFDSDRGGSNFELYTMTTAGASVAALTSNATYDSWWPRISPNRRSIIFYRTPAGVHDLDFTQTSLWACAVDGSGVVQLRPPGTNGWAFQGHGEFSPNGNQLVMFGGSLTAPQIHVTDHMGRNPVAITARVSENVDPSFSPDGQTVAFTTIADGAGGDPDFRTYEIYAVPTGGGTAIRLTADIIRDHDPYFSPDGLSLAWLSQTVTGNPGVWDIRISPLSDMGAAGGFVTPRLLVGDTGITSRPQWSADSATIYMHRIPPAGGAWGIWKIAADGTGLTNITSGHPGNNEYPAT